MQWIIQDKFKLLKVIYLNEFVFAAVVELPSYVLKVPIIALERQMRKNTQFYTHARWRIASNRMKLTSSFEIKYYNLFELTR